MQLGQLGMCHSAAVHASACMLSSYLFHLPLLVSQFASAVCCSRHLLQYFSFPVSGSNLPGGPDMAGCQRPHTAGLLGPTGESLT